MFFRETGSDSRMSSRDFPPRTVLFQKEASGVTYRVPALVFLPRSATFLTFCEERLSPADSQAHLLVMRKGSFCRNHVEWRDVEVLSTARLEGHRSMNPCPVYDDFTGTVFLFFIAVLGHTSESHQLITGKNVTRLCCVSSADQGDSWSSAQDLTAAVIGEAITDWATFAVGPGHGTQLKCGRLVVPAYVYRIDCRSCFGRACRTSPHPLCFYSDSHGRAWHRGEVLATPDGVECQMVAVDQEEGVSVLYCNARSASGCRVQAVSRDGGAAFGDGQLVPKLPEPRNGCHGSVVGFPAPVGPPDFLPPTWVVYSHPTWSTARRDLGVHLSPRPRDPDGWSGPWVIYEGPSAYSDLAYLELGADGGPGLGLIACLFENGSRSAYEEISFCMFTVYQLIQHLPRPRAERRRPCCSLC